MRGDGGVVGVGADVGFGAEVGEVEHGGGEGSERGREGELGCRGEVELGFGAGAGAKAMELGAECLLDLGGGAGEGDAVAIGWEVVDGEAVGLEPGLGGDDVGVGDAEAGGEVGGCEPVMEERRGWVGLLREKLLEVGLLRGGALEDEGDAADGSVGRERAEVVGDADVWIERAFERDGGVELDGAADACSGSLRESEDRAKKQSRDRREPSEPMDRADAKHVLSNNQ